MIAYLPDAAAEWVLLALAACGASSILGYVYHRIHTYRRRAEAVSVSLLVLARNQEEQIEGVMRTLAGLVRVGQEAGGRIEVVGVDCCSTDQTPLIMERFCRQHPSMHYVQVSDKWLKEQSPCEVGLFMCQNRMILVFDLRGAVRVESLIQAAKRLLLLR